jgi:WD40 repeat protein
VEGDDGTGETLLAATIDATEASLRPHLATSAVPAAADYGDLVTVDPTHYAIDHELARGGMGRILEARDRRLGRSVAIKEVLHLDETALARFEREARITARLEHPGIVHVHEAGRWPSGQPFYAMKLIRGRPLDACIAQTPTFGARLALLPTVIAVVDALAFAHSQHVIHRDLKPANVLVGDYGETVVIDWGLAKDLAAHDADDLPLGPVRTSAQDGETVDGAVIGTPAYMPPEQAAGERVDARADVYALGALLYQLLAGVPPYHGRTTAELLEKVLATSPVPLGQREPAVPADLIAIVEKAMARDPSARFASAGEMVSELKRFQTGQLVASHRYTRRELIRRWVKRYRAAVAVGAIALVTLGALGTIGLWKIFAERSRADREAALATVRADDGTLARASAALATDPTEALALLAQLSRGAPQWRGARTIAADAASRGVAFVLATHEPVTQLAFDRAGTHLVSHHPSGRAEIWDLATWTSRPLEVGSELLDLAFTDDGGLVAVDYQGTVRRWELASGAMTVLRTGHGDHAEAVFSPDATRLVVFERFEPATLVDLRPGGTDRMLTRYSQGAWAPDGRSLVLLDRDDAGRVDRFELATGKTTLVADAVQPMSIATDGTLVWIGFYDGTLRELTTGAKLELGAPVNLLAGAPGVVVSANAATRFSTRATTLAGRDKWGGHLTIDPSAVTTADFSVTISDGRPSGNLALRGHASPVQALAVSPAGRIASADRDGVIRIWSRPAVARTHGDGHTIASQAMLTRDHRTLVLTRRGPALEVRDLATGQLRTIAVTELPAGHVVPGAGAVSIRATRIGDRLIAERTEGPDDEATKLVASEDGRTLATLDAAQHLVVWNLDTGRGRLVAEHVLDVAISPDGKQLASTDDHGALQRWNVATGAATLLGTGYEVTALAIAGDGRIAVANRGQTAMVQLFGAHQVVPLDTDGDTCRALAFAEAGKTLVCGGDHWLVRTWSLDTLAARSWGGHSGTITALVVSPDGRLVGSASADHTVRILRLADGSVSELRGHTGFITSIVFGDDDTVVTTSTDRTSRIWDLRAHLDRPLVGHEDTVLFATPLADPPRVLAVDRFHQIAEYPDDLPRDEAGLRAWLAAATNRVR